MICIASDHAGFELKSAIATFLKDADINFVDIGPHEYEATDDYPDFIIPAAVKVAEDLENNRGIILGKSGQGEMIAANKVPGIRAVLYNGGPDEIITLSREHNDANILSIGAAFMDRKKVQHAIKLWLDTSFPGDKRHARRIQKITDYENNR